MAPVFSKVFFTPLPEFVVKQKSSSSIPSVLMLFSGRINIGIAVVEERYHIITGEVIKQRRICIAVSR